MVVGESGLGKSTLVNSLFLGDLYKNRVVPSASDKIDKTTKIEKKTMDIEERGIRLRLSIVDTPGKLLNDVIFLAFCQVNIYKSCPYYSIYSPITRIICRFR